MTYFASFRGDNPRAWLLQIVRNTAWSRPRGPRLEALDDDAGASLIAPGPDPEAALAQTEAHSQLSRMMARLPAELRERFTRVLRGHIAIARLVFPPGVTGAHIDGFARAALWQVGLDYDHGTGHGVGSYLSVHEGPVSLSRAARPIALQPGMILSNEPGYYEPNGYGIRLENLVLVQKAALPAATRRFLSFETLSLAPFEPRLIDWDGLNAEETAWLDAYHLRVFDTLAPHLDAATCEWLRLTTQKASPR